MVVLFKKKLLEEGLKYWEEKSFMLAIPPSSNEDYIEGIYERVLEIDGVKIIDTKPIEFNKPGMIKFTYDGVEYIVEIYISKFSIPISYVNKKYYFTEKELKEIEKATSALSISMKFHNNPKKDYHLQLKLAYAMVPDMVCLIDESAEKILPPKWVKMTALSFFGESSEDLYTIQAIYEKNGEVWLHTHGLNRCGITELEVLGSNKENYNNHYHLINTYASFLINKFEEKFNPRERSAYIGVLKDRRPVVVISLSWTEALSYYKKITVGNLNDRKDSHNGFSSVIFLYKSEKDEQRNKLSKISDYDSLWGDNPIFFISNAETDRMREVARERIGYVLDEFKKGECEVILKIGLPVKEEYGGFEHIWFELLEVKGEKFKCRLTQEPYNVENMHTGDIDWYTVDDITDWIIYTKEFTITPNNVYILMK